MFIAVDRDVEYLTDVLVLFWYGGARIVVDRAIDVLEKIVGVVPLKVDAVHDIVVTDVTSVNTVVFDMYSAELVVAGALETALVTEGVVVNEAIVIVCVVLLVVEQVVVVDELVTLMTGGHIALNSSLTS